MTISHDDTFAFSQIPIPERQEKPRSMGLTMMIDWGLPLGLQKDCLATHGPGSPSHAPEGVRWLHRAS